MRRQPLLKAQTPLRSSDVRRLRQQVTAMVAARLRSAENTEDSLIDGEDADMRASRVVPKSDFLIYQARFQLPFGNADDPDAAQQQQQQQNILYSCRYDGPSSHLQPILFTLDEFREQLLIPTVYALWKCPEMVPVLFTHSSVFVKLANGADLMLPGVLNAESNLPKFGKNELVAIMLTDGPNVPVGIGISLCSSEEILQTPRQERKGKALNVLHIYGDALWAMGDRSDPPENASGDLRQTHTDPAVVKHGEDGFSDEVEAFQTDDEHKRKLDDVPSLEELSVAEPQVAAAMPSTEEMDDLFLRSLLMAVVSMNIAEQSAKLLPLPSSTLYSAYMVPCRPAGTILDIKKTTHKKLSKFLKAVDKMGVIQIKEMKNGDILLMAVHLQHERIKSFRPFKTAGATAGSSEGPATSSKETAVKADISSSELVHEVWYRPSGSALAALFQRMNASTNEFYRAVDIRELLNAYVKQENLVDTKQPKCIGPDSILSPLVLRKEDTKKDVQVPLLVPRDQLMDRVLPKFHVFYTLRRKDDHGQQDMRKGTLKPVQIVLERRQGRKTVTRVWYLEPYGIDVAQMAKELQKKCACSTSVGDSAFSSAAHPVQEVLLQGYALAEVTDMLLSKYGVPKRLIEVQDKVGSSKKKK